MKKISFLFIFLVAALLVKADEGMWLLKELNRQSIARMQELGFSFPTDSIYSETNPSLKDAVVIFGRGCTGVAVSQQGLIFTNHHCGYGDIQKLSSVEHDYLKDGFVSQSFGEELPAGGLSVSFLKETEDITDFVTSTLLPDDSEDIRNKKIDSLSSVYIQNYKNQGKNHLQPQIIPFFSKNKYYLVVYEVFNDVRLVFSPPSSIGKFGGETDNWMWPRHTGDFSVFRVYANKNNESAGYSPDNVPYIPKYSVPVSLKGYKENDYAMTIGYPGRTQRYMSSWGIDQKVQSVHKPRIEVRGAKQEIWKEAMNADDAIRIKYATKYAGSSNYWKNAMGMNAAIEKLDIIKGKEQLESKFSQWVASSGKSATYGEVLSTLRDNYTATMDGVAKETYLQETFFNGIEIAYIGRVAHTARNKKEEHREIDIRTKLEHIYKDYVPSLDKKVMPVLLKLYAERVPVEDQPAIYKTIREKFKGDYDKYTEWFFKNTKLTNLDDIIKFVLTAKDKDFEKDPAIQLAKSLEPCVKNLRYIATHQAKISREERLFIAGLMEMEPNKTFSPDANFTQRLSYGSVKGYKPADAVEYDYYSTSKGVLDKQIPNDPEFGVQEYVLDHIAKGDFGQYADEDRSMHVNFLSNNDITGGNSGSPVFDGKAQLIGLAFDGNWDSLSGDIVFDPELQHTISVDIRYVLYMIDKVMKCPRLINELKVVK